MTDPLRILIAGSRRVPRSDEAKIRQAINDAILRQFGDAAPYDSPDLVGQHFVLVHGDCPEPKIPLDRNMGTGQPKDIVLIDSPDHTSIDQIARRLGEEVYDGQEPFPADWERHGKAAGPMRNIAMSEANLDFAVLCPGGRGTESMARELIRARVAFEFVVP